MLFSIDTFLSTCSLIQQLGLKIPLMQLMEDKNLEVKKHALLAIQKLMVTNWEYLTH
jgi:hypothetical protein